MVVAEVVAVAVADCSVVCLAGAAAVDVGFVAAGEAHAEAVPARQDQQVPQKDGGGSIYHEQYTTLCCTVKWIRSALHIVDRFKVYAGS